MNAETVFWIVHLPLMLLFLIGMGVVLRTWFRGRVEGYESDSTGRKGLRMFGTALSAIFSRQFPLVVKTFVTEVWFNRRLWRASFWRWLNHFLLLSGFMLLMTLSGIAALSDKLLNHVFHLGDVPWIAMWYNPDHPVTAVLNEAGGLLMTIGFLFFFVRRYVFRVPQLRTDPMDTWMTFGLGLILLSGWAAEIVRLNSSHALSTAYLSFVGYPLSRLFVGLQLDWDRLFEWMYVGHGLLTSVVIVTIPFSKFMHVIAGGLLAWMDQFQEETASGRRERGGAHVGV
ncbi:MAG: respiratory nitrate reductase subunit gamma [Anaerolineae bacterium]|jgi:nitrate reductase gamma subunit